MCRAVPPLPQYTFMAWCSVKARVLDVNASYPMSTRDSFPGVKRPGREADHSPSSIVQVKECVELYLHFPIRLHALVLSLKNTGTTVPLPLTLHS